MKSFTSHLIEETEKFASDWIKEISNKYADLDEALIVGLSGHLGEGKTAFTKAVAKTLGITEDVTSPTFVIMKIYAIGSNGGNDPIGSSTEVRPPFELQWKRLIHIDAYRLERRKSSKRSDLNRWSPTRTI